MTQTGVCGGCIFYSASPEFDQKGWCRRYPPIVAVVDGKEENAQPFVDHYSWCGEHKDFSEM